MRLPSVASTPSRRFASVLLLASTAAAVPLLAPPAVQAQLVIVNGYEIQTVQGPFGTGTIGNIDLQQTPWWGSQSRADDFARAVGGQLGAFADPSFGSVGPGFAWESVVISDVPLVDACFALLDNGAGTQCQSPVFLNTWAYAVPVPNQSVPGPLPVLGAAAAFGFSRKLRKRIKSSNLPLPVFTCP